MADLRLDGGAGYGVLLAEALTWPADTPVTLVLDESATPGGMHILRRSLAYRGSCLPLAWAVWPHQPPLAPGQYWRYVDTVLERVVARRPPGVRVVLLADRAYDIPPRIDRLTSVGWDGIIRGKARRQLGWREADGRAPPPRALVAAPLDQSGRRVRRAGQPFKKAGWRPVHVVGEWGRRSQEPLVVLTSLPPRWTVLSRYARRFWIEAAFRQDKSHGWDWGHSQIREPPHQARLVLALAWASVLVLSLGAREAARATTATRGTYAQPSHPRDRLFHWGWIAATPCSTAPLAAGCRGVCPGRGRSVGAPNGWLHALNRNLSSHEQRTGEGVWASR